jgi:site-specific recombinase XerD
MWDELSAWAATLEGAGLAPTTVAHYVLAVRRFALWLAARRRGATLASIDVEDARAYRADLVARGYAPSTINAALTALRLFVAASGRSADNPFHRIPLLPQQ